MKSRIDRVLDRVEAKLDASSKHRQRVRDNDPYEPAKRVALAMRMGRLPEASQEARETAENIANILQMPDVAGQLPDAQSPQT